MHGVTDRSATLVFNYNWEILFSTFLSFFDLRFSLRDFCGSFFCFSLDIIVTLPVRVNEIEMACDSLCKSRYPRNNSGKFPLKAVQTIYSQRLVFLFSGTEEKAGRRQRPV